MVRLYRACLFKSITQKVSFIKRTLTRSSPCSPGDSVYLSLEKTLPLKTGQQREMPWSRAADESLVQVRQTQRLCNFCAVPSRERKTGGICSRSHLGANRRKATMFCKGTALRERSCDFPRHKEKHTQSLSGCFKCLFPSRGMMSGGCSAPQPPKPPSVPCSTSRGAPSQPPESQVLSLPH